MASLQVMPVLPVVAIAGGYSELLNPAAGEKTTLSGGLEASAQPFQPEEEGSCPGGQPRQSGLALPEALGAGEREMPAGTQLIEAETEGVTEGVGEGDTYMQRPSSVTWLNLAPAGAFSVHHSGSGSHLCCNRPCKSV